MHVGLNSKFPAAPAYVDMKLYNAGGVFDGEESYMLHHLGLSSLGSFIG